MSITDLKIRKLKHKDRKRLSKLLLMLVEKVGNKDLLSMVSKEKTTSPEADKDSSQLDVFGIEMLKNLFIVLEDEMIAWFADLLNVKIEDFDDLPFDVELQIIQQIKEDPGFSSFFSIALQLFSSIKQYLPKSLTEKML